MKRLVGVLGALAVAGFLNGCSSDEQNGDTLAVHGTVSQRGVVDNARAVATGTDGRTFWAYLDAHRDFTLKLPVGQSYRIVIANQVAGGGQRTIGRVTFAGLDGRTDWLGANEGGDIDLGYVRPLAATSAGVHTQCNSCSSGGGGDGYGKDDDEDNEQANHDDDHSCHEKGSSEKDDEHKSCSSCGDEDEDEGEGKGSKDDDECDVCRDGKDDELAPSKAPDASKCEDRDKGKRGAGNPGSYDDQKPCTKGKKGKSGGDEANESGGGSKSEGSSCQVTNECSSACSCVAAKCAQY